MDARNIAVVALKFLDGCSFVWGDLPAMNAVRDMLGQIADGRVKVVPATDQPKRRVRAERRAGEVK